MNQQVRHEQKIEGSRLSVVGVATLFRHGERLPMKVTRLPGESRPPSWLFCHLENTRTGRFEHHGAACEAQQLTDLGWMSLARLGQQFRERYIHDCSILPKKMPAAKTLKPTSESSEQPDSTDDRFRSLDSLVVKSTNTSRTIASAEAFLDGLYPKSYRHPNAHCDVFVENGGIMSPWFGPCSNLQVLVKKYRQDRHKDVEAFAQHFRKRHGDAFFDELDWSKPHHLLWALVGITDETKSRDAHGVAAPDALTNASLKDLATRFLEMNYVDPLRRSARLLRLCAGPLLNDMADSLASMAADDKAGSGTASVAGDTVAAVAEQRPSGAPRFVVYSAHDTTLSPVLLALDHLNEWPPFAASVTFELLKEAAKPAPTETAAAADATQPQYFVRALYQNEPFVIRSCLNWPTSVFSREGMPSIADVHPGDRTLCPLPRFLEIARDFEPRPDDCELAGRFTVAQDQQEQAEHAAGKSN